MTGCDARRIGDVVASGPHPRPRDAQTHLFIAPICIIASIGMSIACA
jgi:hypothetical protein